MRVLQICDWYADGPQLTFRCSLDGRVWSTTYWYDSVDFSELRERFGVEAVESMVAHIVLFEVNKVCSLAPDVVDPGPLRVGPALVELWSSVLWNVWAQWRWGNDLPQWDAPVLVSNGDDVEPFGFAAEGAPLLVASGGGKDSLVAGRLLDRGGVVYETLGYSHSVYGEHAAQHALIEGLVVATGSRRHHRVWMLDEFSAVPVLELANPAGVRTLCAAETPASLFASVPVLAAHGFSGFAVGHERSADAANLFWEAAGEEVNHQWGKSTAAEELLGEYVSRYMFGTQFFSTLKPVHDLVIFELLRHDEDLLHLAHSCNVRKPWCRQCPKCAYVWSGYKAHLSTGPVSALFPDDLTDDPVNAVAFAQMTGFGDRNPFECIGEIPESQVNVACIAARFPSSSAVLLADRVGPLDVEAIVGKYCGVNADYLRAPERVRAAVTPLLEAASVSARSRITGLLSHR